MPNQVKFRKVVVNHTGGCEGYTFIAGEPVRLPERVLEALGEKEWKDAPRDSEEKEETKEPTEYQKMQERAKELGLPYQNVPKDKLKESIKQKEEESEEDK